MAAVAWRRSHGGGRGGGAVRQGAEAAATKQPMPPRTPHASSADRTYQRAIVFSSITLNSPKHIVG